MNNHRITRSARLLRKMKLDPINHIGYNHLGFDEVIVHAEALGTLLVAFLAEGGEHDNFEIGGFGRVAEDIQHIKAADLGHHGVQQDEVGPVIFGSREGVFAVGDTFYVEGLGLQTHYVDVCQRVIVLDEQNLFAF